MKAFFIKLFAIPLIALIIVAGSSVSNLVAAQTVPTFAGGDILRGLNHTRGGGESDPIDADPGNAIEFVFQVANNNPDSTATGVVVRANLPATPSNNLTVSANANSNNGVSVSDTATVRIVDGSNQGLEYIAGHTRVFSKDCPSGCSGDHFDSVVRGGVNVGDLAFNESAQVFFKAFVTNFVVATPTPTVPAPTATPTPTPTTPAPTATPTPTPTPGPTTTVTPTPTPVPAGQTQTQTQTQNNTQTNNQNQTVNVTTTQAAAAKPAVAGVSSAKTLPKTGLPVLAWAAAAFLPAGFRLRKFRSLKVNDQTETPQYLWEKREYRRES